MGWLGLKKRPGHDKDEEDQLEQEAQPLLPLTPVLNLLVPDIAGVTSFHLRQFFDVEEAQEFIQSLPSISGLHAFWGLHEPPPGHEDGEETGEAMVLIRSAENSDTVYVVSFVDLDSALSFARFEVKRGMSLGLLLLYWAEIVEVEANEQGIRLSPDAPPLPGFESRRFAQEDWPQPAAEPAEEAVAVAQAPAVNAVIEEPDPAVIEETEAETSRMPDPGTGWETETSETFDKATEEEFEQFVAEQEELRAAEQPAPEVQIEEPAETEEEVPEPQAVSIKEPEPVAAEPEAEPRTQEEIDIEREALAFLKASANGKKAALEPEAAPEAVAESASAPEVAVEEFAAPEPEPEPTPVAPVAQPEPEISLPEPDEVPEAVAVRAQVTVPALREHESEEELTEDRVEEVEKILKVKRWDKRESPFRGFDSPPGRF